MRVLLRSIPSGTQYGQSVVWLIFTVVLYQLELLPYQLHWADGYYPDAIRSLLGSWVVILVSYIVGMIRACSQPKVQGLSYVDYADRWHFYHHQEREQSCLEYCNCETILKFDGVSFNGQNFYSPCHAGCRDYDVFSNSWSNCQCVFGHPVQKGLVHPKCDIFFTYLAVMMIGLFIGNLFFMATMMIVLRSVFDEVIALSLASFITNLFGFIPAPVIYGFFIDLCCILWNRKCPNERGNFVLYDNDKFSKMFHGVNSFFQIFAIIFAGICYWVSKSVKLPEEMPMVEFPESREREYRDDDEEWSPLEQIPVRLDLHVQLLENKVEARTVTSRVVVHHNTSL